MNMKPTIDRYLGVPVLLFILMFGLAACGGDDNDNGGGSNRAPTVDAGADFAVDENTAATLAPDAEDADGDTLEYLVEQTAGPTVELTSAGDTTLAFTAPEVAEDTVLSFKVTVSDPDGAEASDTVNVTVRQVNAAPEAVASAPEAAQYEQSVVMLSAAASQDPDGDELSYSWAQLTGSPLEISDANTATASITLPRMQGFEDYEFQVTVSDGELSSTATVAFTAREANKVVFTGNFDDEEGKAGIWSVALPDGERVSLFDQRGEIWHLVVSPDNRYVAFSFDPDFGGSQSFSIYVAEIGVAHSAELVFDGATEFLDILNGDGVGDGVIDWMAWSPAGDRLAFTTRQAGLGTLGNLLFSNLYMWSEASGLANLTGFEPKNTDNDLDYVDISVAADDGNPQWAPDGSRIAYLVAEDHDDALEGYVRRLFTVEPLADAEPVDVSHAALWETDVLANAPLYGLPGRAPEVVRNDDPTATGLGVDDASIITNTPGLDCEILPDSDANMDCEPDGTVRAGRFGWSANGQLYFIASSGHVEVDDIHVVDGDGSNHRRLTAIASTDEDGDRRADSDFATDPDGIADGGVDNARWSPDGMRLAYRAALAVNRPKPGNPEFTLPREWIAHVDDAIPVVEVVPDRADLKRISRGNYDWSPDGGHLVYGIEEEAGSGTVPTIVYKLGAYDIATRRTQTLTAEGGTTYAYLSGWDAAGRAVVAMDTVIPGPGIFIVSMDGKFTAPVFHSRDDIEALTAIVSPDGRSIAVAVNEEVVVNEETGETEIVDHDFAVGALEPAAALVTVDDPGEYDFWGYWSPDGEHFVGINELITEEEFHRSLQYASRDGSAARSRITGEAGEFNDGLEDGNFRVIGPATGPLLDQPD